MPHVRDSWDVRIRRAEALAADGGNAKPLLDFYTTTLRAQRRIFDRLAPRRPSGFLDRDVSFVRAAARPLFEDVARHGPEPLAHAARELIASSDAVVDQALLTNWQSPCARAFFPKAILQPYGEWIAQAGVGAMDRHLPRTDGRCPRCGGAPQLSILQGAGAPGENLQGAGAPGENNVEGAAAILESGGRQLQCANCLGRWPFGRVRCAHCGEENEAKLGYFHSEELAHLRIDSCDTCRRYLKTIDLGRIGLAVPLVDEVGAVALDAWAVERGYEKIELNLVGM